jgi:hypothetical protein
MNIINSRTAELSRYTREFELFIFSGAVDKLLCHVNLLLENDSKNKQLYNSRC